MKDVERLLERARAIMASFQFGVFPDDDDGFMEALGVDKSKYEVKIEDGTIGYDFLAALSDLAAEDWKDFAEPCKAEVKQKAKSCRDKEKLEAKTCPDKAKPEELPKKSRKVQGLFGWG